MADKYFPADFEKKWTDRWLKEKTYKTPSKTTAGKSKMYALSMFPYPSGAGLHVGHVRIYTGTDVMARFFRMSGHSVLHPMGWDAFGLPAENAAIKAKKNPMDMVPTNIENFKRQMQVLGLSYDWDKEFTTTDPEYYKWTQWLFIQFFKMGLLYKKNTPINFCPVCKTGLAEEEVLPDGTHERCGNKITKKDLPQWIFKITSYADRLLKELDGLDWPDGILQMQRNWIGRKEGINITYSIIDQEAQSSVSRPPHPKGAQAIDSKQRSSLPAVDQITCFTTRPDTNFGATFIVIAPEHEFVKKILNSKSEIRNKCIIPNSKIEEIKKYVEGSLSKTEMERESEGRKKTGVFTGFYAVNNLNNKLMPVWISDFVLAGFGTGAVVGVPGHDLRDFEFAREFGIEIIRVVVGKDGKKGTITKKEEVQEEEGMMINSGFLDGLDIHLATKKIMDYMEEKGWGKRIVTYHLRDWIFSRQRYWGEPIPMVFCPKCQDQSSNVLIIHGTWGSGDGNWFPWFADYMNESGIETAHPTLPDTKLPDYETRTKFIESNYKKFLSSSSIIIGHSSGVGSALHLAEKYKIDQLLLVAPVLYIDEKYKKELAEAFDEKTADALQKLYSHHEIDWEKIKRNVNKITVIFGEKDPYLPKGFVDFAKEKFGESNVHIVSGIGYFSTATKDPLKIYQVLNYIELKNIHGWLPIEDKNLPLKLPYLKSYEPSGTGESPLATAGDWLNIKCPQCGELAKRETDTMPNWAGSCWYFLAFPFWQAETQYHVFSPASPQRGPRRSVQKQMLSFPSIKDWSADWRMKIENSREWLPVDWYLGGAEHAVLHLLYSRFWVKALQDLKLLDFNEPFLRLRNVGMVLAEDHRKMSKSLGNVINPDDVILEFGADSLRIYEMFMAPFNAEIAWSTKALQGSFRFLKRIWEIYHKEFAICNQQSAIENKNLVSKLNKTINKVTEDIKQTKFNTAIAAMMEFLNDWEKAAQGLSKENAKKFLQILAPFAPYITEEIWKEVFKEPKSIHLSDWPKAQKIIDALVTIPVQINGKVRSVLSIKYSAASIKEEVEKVAVQDEKIKKYLEEKKYRVIFVPGKIINFIVN